MAFVNTESGSQRLLPSRSTGGISAMASIWTHRAIAYSPRSVTPDVVIVRHPALPDGLGGQLVSTLAGATDLEIVDIGDATPQQITRGTLCAPLLPPPREPFCAVSLCRAG